LKALALDNTLAKEAFIYFSKMKKPSVSIILTVYNKDFLIDRVIRSIIENKASNTKELVLVFDGCTDNSEAVARETLKGVSDIAIIYAETPNVYETKANNVGLKLATSNYSMIVQDDMIIQEKDFDARMLKPFIFGDAFAVGSRLAHNDFYRGGQLGWGDFIGFDPYNKSIMPARRDMYYIRDLCNRGPLVVDNEKMQTLNYFDESFWPQNMDDHDIGFRAWKEHGWVSGSYWIKWYSEEDWGGTRQDKEKYPWFERHNAINHQKIIERHMAFLHPENKHNEERLVF